MNGEKIFSKNIFLIPFNITPNFYAFLGGVFISMAVNLYTNIFAGDDIPARWKVILISAILAFLSGSFCSVVAWNLELINRLAILQSPEFVDEQKIRRQLLLNKTPKLILYLGCAFLCAVISSLILLF